MNTGLDLRLPFHGGDRCRVGLEAGIRKFNGTRPQTPEIEKNYNAEVGRPVDTYSSIRLDTE
jgi:hypothetical protein